MWCQKEGIFGFLRQGNDFDRLDLAATMVGGIVCALFHYLYLDTFFLDVMFFKSHFGNNVIAGETYLYRRVVY